MTDGLVARYLSRPGATAATADAAPAARRFQEMTGTSGELRPGWVDLARLLDVLGPSGLAELDLSVERLLEDDGVVYTPIAGTYDGGPTAPERWRLDPLPLVVEDAEWQQLEAGLIQRSVLLDAVMTDLYGPQALLDLGLLPPELVFGHSGYLRAAAGIRNPGAHQLFFHAVDVVRDGQGAFRALGDRSQAPSGAGYALADRRVVSRVLPDLFRRSAPRGLGAFFHTMRSALISVAPRTAEDPRVVVLSPDTHSESGFDHALLASTLGVPLVETADLTVRHGRLWMLSVGRLEPVDVVVRRVDADWSDPLELRPTSRYGVVGLTEVARRGAVSVVNPIGSGLLESPGLLPFLPELAGAILGESLKLPSQPSFWCGRPIDLDHVLAHFEQMVLLPTDRGRSIHPARLSRAEQAAWRDRVRAEPHRWVGQSISDLAEAPIADPTGLRSGQVSMRLFSVAHGSGYVAMPGALGRTQDVAIPGGPSVAKDVWVQAPRRSAGRDRVWLYEGPTVTPVPVESTSSPRVLEDMFWLGRYAERAEDLIRLLNVTRERIDEFRFRPDHPGAGTVPVLLAAVSAVTGTRPSAPGDPLRYLRDLLLDGADPGSVAQSLTGLRSAARAVRDQLSDDTWIVLAGMDRAIAELAAAPDSADGGGILLESAQAAVLTGMLALSGMAAENMVRDPGWHFLDLGHRIERAQQLTALLRATLRRSHGPAVDSLVVESVLTVGESGVTYRRRYRGRIQIATMLELLLLDPGNPRSVAYQVAQARTDLRALPVGSATSRPARRLEEIDAVLRRCRPEELEVENEIGERVELTALLDGLNDAFRAVADATTAQHFWRPAPMVSFGLDGLVETR
ncbi:hypothetical protein FDO65_01285 [Nakamurella flava]|uniref:Uncharacterized protein n=1 Tax=Nakamurella flava TaxID=2576308 RepID=A0A4U6QIY9_9ACTN|nr:circularly permuted type 2 ATP-grasp protein [Nakamurella flava]TKV60380.1 hypothetical protein FDO65_01285 [Nakamurella flava]